MPYQSLAHAILADWRSAERDLATLDEAPERKRLERQVERLRHEYHRLAFEAARNMQPLPEFPRPK